MSKTIHVHLHDSTRDEDADVRDANNWIARAKATVSAIPRLQDSMRPSDFESALRACEEAKRQLDMAITRINAFKVG